MNFARIAGEISRRLGHGCAPEINVLNEINTIDDLYQAMVIAAEINDEDNSFPCFGPWNNEQDGILTHTTGSGRMKIEVSDHSLVIELFSKSYYFGCEPFARLTLAEETFFEILDEKTVKNNIYRLFGIVDIMPAIMDFAVFLTVVSCADEDKILLLDAFLKRFQEEKDYHSERYPNTPNDWGNKIEKVKTISNKEFRTSIDLDYYEEKYA